ncbi:MAG: AraC family transcriptional regulator [Bacteroidales bacterium]|nr:AraC family transcriptional regulator [Bacteroidales bacterium]
MFCKFVSIEDASEIFVIAIDEDFFCKANYGLPSEFYDIVNKQPIITLDKGEICIYSDFIADYEDIIAKNYIYTLKLLANLLNNLTLVSFEFWQKQPKNSKITTNNNELTQLCRDFYNLVAKECKHHHGVEYYAEKLGVSRNYLTKTVSKITKQTPKEAIHRQLVNETKNLLLNSDLTIKEIADRLGFGDASYLCRFFKNKTGKNLTSFRNQRIY